ncbi:P-loop NTPase fold protein [Amycolatopsis rubida]|uniref:KAP family P-loop domain-containing protein n=1 Tax=Amycolatopsis rubida TaxID=112413 RepID=A0A1I5PKI2_9PSEU|nr:P-loop NTPase fold protein [Amycolatopsis rubida]SFP34523.1 KAP family P-loop domain-containing protein [Amycolatopsis rubida]
MAGTPAHNDSGYLGSAGGTSCHVVRTNRPWESGIDAIGVSVGDILGSLGRAVREQSLDSGWDSIDYEAIVPERPYVLSIRGTDRGSLRFAVLMTPHEGGGSSPPTLPAIATAAEAGIRFAARANSSAFGLPLLGTGDLGFNEEEVAAVVIPAAVRALQDTSGLRSLVFVCNSEPAEDAIRAAWHQAGVMRFSAVELAGGVSNDLVDPTRGIPLERDRLGVAPYVSMLATVIADRSTLPPLSVGVFGEWGSGKSYFMGLMRAEVGRLAGSGNPAYCREIVQIGFNAWHYADRNLWASLGDEIFRQLAGPGPNAQQRRDQLREELATRLDQVTELEDAKRQAQATAAKLQADVDKAALNRKDAARVLIRALGGSREVWQRLGIQDEAEQGALLVEQLRGTLSEAEALRRSPKGRWGKAALVASAVILLAGFFVAAIVPVAREWLAGVGVGFAAVAGTGVALLSRARSGFRELRELSEDLRRGIDRRASRMVSPEVARMLEEIRRAETDQRVAEAQLEEVVARVGELGRELTELTPGRNLYAFLADRAHGDSYRRDLGLISTIRKDFEQLVELMDDWRAHPDSAGTPIDRIVLYIDDLDRCGARQVVEVLEAVHLLLALELFVVVVGVDPRWLTRSLHSRYDGMLDDSPDAGRLASPEDYLGKIINLPFVLPTMSEGSLRRLLRSLTDDRLLEPAGEERTQRNPPPATTLPDLVPEIEEGSEVDSQSRPERAADPPRPLTPAEIDLLSELDALISTPREAKRLFNLYRMLRATRDLSAASHFLGDDTEPGDYQAVVALLGLLTAPGLVLEKALDTLPDPERSITGGLVHRPPDAAWAAFVADCAPRRHGEVWRNPVAGTLCDSELRDWRQLHRGLAHVSATLRIDALSRFQHWIPAVRRFSYVLFPTT